MSGLRRLWNGILGCTLAIGIAHLSGSAPGAEPPAARPPQSAPAPGSLRVQHPAEKVEERWYTVELAGQRCGWMRTAEARGEGRITTDSETMLRIKRASVDLVISMRTTFVETEDGRAISVRSVQKLGGSPLDQLYEFGEKGVTLTSVQGGERTVKQVESPQGEWLTPARVEQHTKERLKAGDKTISYRTIDPTVGVKPMTVTLTDIGPAEIEVEGKKIDATRVSVAMSVAPEIKSAEFMDAEGELVRSETTIAVWKVVMTRATKQEAMGKIEAPELMVSTFVLPRGKMGDARKLSRAEYVLTATSGEMPSLAATGSQAVERVDGKKAKVVVDASFPNPPAKGEEADAAYLAASATVDTNDEQVRALHAKAVEGVGKGAGERAEAMRRFIHAHIRTKDLSVGFGTASETARSREGDCTEHGVLLAALLRCDGIPSRVASGLIYIEGLANGKGAFGYHMWTQALLEVDGARRWVDLDATLPDSVSYDAAHIALGVSDLSDGGVLGSLIDSATLVGRLGIEVKGTEIKGAEGARRNGR